MVTIKNYHLREGEQGSFITLELQGEIELVQSANTGRFYATARRCFISSTFDEPTAKLMVGQQIKGNIERVECDPYDFVIEDTGETIQLGYRYDYVPEVRATEHVNRAPIMA